MEYTEIIINWEKVNNIEKEANDIDGIGGLYCVYCDSHIYGKDVLAYIGQTINFRQRLEQHMSSFFKYANNVRFVFGKIAEKYGLSFSDVESILIANHKPFFNKTNIHDISENAKRQNIIIINNNDHGSLKSCVTNYWWVNNNDYKKTMQIAKDMN
ncbi:MAG: GIY-YIG nuclease family protein [Schleiferiaceae bacterium]|nr:GIY-YIG nuclease family protein [Schleiferiaceae bacterium]